MGNYNKICGPVVGEYDPTGLTRPPSIITIMINIALRPGDLNNE